MVLCTTWRQGSPCRPFFAECLRRQCVTESFFHRQCVTCARMESAICPPTVNIPLPRGYLRGKRKKRWKKITQSAFLLGRPKSPRFLLWYPASSSPTKRLPHLPTAATRSGRFSRPRRRSHRSPTEVSRRLFAYFLVGEKVCPQSASEHLLLRCPVMSLTGSQ